MDTTREQASLWLTKLARGLDKEDGPALNDWLRAPENRRTIVHMASSWHGPEVMALLEQLLPEESKRTRRRSRRNLAITALAFAVAIGVVVMLTNALLDGRTLWSYFDGSHLPRTILARTTYVSGIDERRNVQLPDGSTLVLSPATRVSVEYSRPWRNVKLDYGAARFAVAHDPDWPFNVHAGKRDFQAMGGRFAMQVLTPELIELAVSAGTVKVQFATPRRPETDAQRSENLTYGEAIVRPLETARVYPGFQSIRRPAIQ
ncbi:MAG TPA: FecR domain-containing protein [Steroidobacteraceae bacterium]|nr:FecR domain-containing protein [Steroidobacteraceae bacterium]